MDCLYYDESGMCCNAECPVRGDECPVPDVEGLCMYEDRSEDLYKLTPEGCAACALLDCKLVASVDDPAVDSFVYLFLDALRNCGYEIVEVSDEEERR